MTLFLYLKNYNHPSSSYCPFLYFRYGRIKDKFMGSYGKKPDYYARASGRVNLIGVWLNF